MALDDCGRLAASVLESAENENPALVLDCVPGFGADAREPDLDNFRRRCVDLRSSGRAAILHMRVGVCRLRWASEMLGSLLWLWTGETNGPDRWDLPGVSVRPGGAVIILVGPRTVLRVVR